MLGGLVVLQLVTRRSLRFSKGFWATLLAYGGAFAIGLRFGAMPLFVSMLVVALAMKVAFRVKPLPNQRELEEVLDKSRQLEKTDPAAARQLLDDYFQKEDERNEQERKALRKLAPFDLKAAKHLQALLRDDMKGHQAMREHMLPTLPSEKRANWETMIEGLQQQTQRDLEELNNTIKRLASPG